MSDPTVVAVTSIEYEKGGDVFEQAAGGRLRFVRVPEAESQLAAAIADRAAMHAIVAAVPYTGALYDALPRGGVIARFGVGFDGLDLAAATAGGHLCTNTPHVVDDSVAEFTISLILTAARRAPSMVENMRNGLWRQHVGVELRGRRLAVIGCGAIGCRVARMAGLGLGMHVIGCDEPGVDVQALLDEGGFSEIVTDFHHAVSAADFVSLHIPLTSETRGLLGAERLRMLQPRAWLINTARGALIDEAALYEALREERLGGVCLDVFTAEPYAPVASNLDLRTLPNVVMTPHAGSSTTDACRRMARRTVENILLAEAGDYREMDVLNPDVLSTFSAAPA